MPTDRLEELAKLAYDAQRKSLAFATFRPWEALHKAEKEAMRAAVRAVLAAEAVKSDGG